jgi:hypothetical protein
LLERFTNVDSAGYTVRCTCVHAKPCICSAFLDEIFPSGAPVPWIARVPDSLQQSGQTFKTDFMVEKFRLFDTVHVGVEDYSGVGRSVVVNVDFTADSAKCTDGKVSLILLVHSPLHGYFTFVKGTNHYFNRV